MAEKEAQAGYETTFRVCGYPLDMVVSFPYLGLILIVTDGD